jgi:glycosyltransferase involved in cell wall biosynthesis
LLAVGSVAPHKNLGALARALARLPPGLFQVVVAGAADARLFADARLPSCEGLRWLGRVTDGELRALYANATALVFPSSYEGFGLPPLEAMALGCPVVCSRAASLPEVCGDAALYFDPQDDRALADAMVRVTHHESVREGLVHRGRQRLELYSWRKAAEAYWSAMADWLGTARVNERTSLRARPTASAAANVGLA